MSRIRTIREGAWASLLLLGLCGAAFGDGGGWGVGVAPSSIDRTQETIVMRLTLNNYDGADDSNGLIFLRSVAFTLLGAADPTDQIRLKLIRDGGDGVLDDYDNTLAGGDTLVASAYFTSHRMCTLGSGSTSLSQIANGASSLFWVVARPERGAGKSFGISLMATNYGGAGTEDDREWIKWWNLSGSVTSPYYYFSAGTGIAHTIAPTYRLTLMMGPATLSLSYVREGQMRPMVQMSMWTQSGLAPATGEWRALGVTLLGTTTAPDQIQLQVRQDSKYILDLPYWSTGPNGVFEEAYDNLQTLSTFDTSARTARLAPGNAAAEGNTYAYWLVVKPLSVGAGEVGRTVRLTFGVSTVDANGDTAVFLAGARPGSSEVTLLAANADIAEIRGVPVEDLGLAPAGNAMAFLRLTLWLSDPAPSGLGSGSALLTMMTVSLMGSPDDPGGANALPPSSVSFIGLFKDTQVNGIWDDPGDSLVAGLSAAGGFAVRLQTLSDLAITLAAATQRHFLVVGLGASAEEEKDIGITLVGYRVDETTDRAAYRGVAATPAAVDQPDNVTVAHDAAYTPVTSVTQGGTAGILRITLRVNQDTANFKQMRVTLVSGSGVSARLRKDTGNGQLGGEDQTLGSWVSFSSEGRATLGTDLNNVYLAAGVDAVLFMEVKLATLAPVGGVVTLAVAQAGDIEVNRPDLVSLPAAITSRGVQVADAGDPVVLDSVGAVLPAGTTRFVRGGERNLLLTFRAYASQDEARMTHLTVGVGGTVNPAKVTLILFGESDLLPTFGAAGFNPSADRSLMAAAGGAGGRVVIAGLQETLRPQDLTYQFIGLVRGGEYYLQCEVDVGEVNKSLQLSLGPGGPLRLDDPDVLDAYSVGGTPLLTIAPPGAQYVTVQKGPLGLTSVKHGELRRLLQLTMWATGGVSPSRLTCDVIGTAAPAKLTLRLYADASGEGEGTFDPWGDTSLTSTWPDGSGRAVLDVSGVSLTLTPRSYFVVAQVDVSQLDATVGLSILDSSFLQLPEPHRMESFPIPLGAGPVPVHRASLVATWTQPSPPFLKRGQVRPFLQVTLRPDASSLVWTTLKAELTGTAAVTEIAFKLYRESGASPGWLASDDVLVGSATFRANRKLTLAALDQTLGLSTFYLCLEASLNADVTKTAGLSVAGQAEWGVRPPDGLVAFTASAATSPIVSIQPVSTVNLNWRAVAPASQMQGAAADWLRLTLSTTNDEAIVNALTLVRNGPTGATLISEVRLLSPSGTTLAASPGGTALTHALSGFSWTLSTTPAVFRVSATILSLAAIGGQASLTLLDAAQIGIALPDVLAGAATPAYPVAAGGVTVADGMDRMRVQWVEALVGDNLMRQGELVQMAIATLYAWTEQVTATALTLSLAGSADPTTVTAFVGVGAPLTHAGTAVNAGGRGIITLPGGTTTPASLYLFLKSQADVGSTVFMTLQPRVGAVSPDGDEVGDYLLPSLRMTMVAADADKLRVRGWSVTGGELPVETDRSLSDLSLVGDLAGNGLAWQRVSVTLGGNVTAETVTAKLFRDANGNKVFDASADVSLTSCTFSAGRWGTLELPGGGEAVGANFQSYFLVGRASALASAGSYLQFRVLEGANVGVAAPDAVAPFKVDDAPTVQVLGSTTVEVSVVRPPVHLVEQGTFGGGAFALTLRFQNTGIATGQIEGFLFSLAGDFGGASMSYANSVYGVGGSQTGTVSATNRIGSVAAILTLGAGVTREYQMRIGPDYYVPVGTTLRVELLSVVAALGTFLSGPALPLTVQTIVVTDGQDLITGRTTPLLPPTITAGSEVAFGAFTLTSEPDGAVLMTLTVDVPESGLAGAATFRVYKDDGDGSWFMGGEQSLGAGAVTGASAVAIGDLRLTLEAGSQAVFVSLSLTPTAPAGTVIRTNLLRTPYATFVPLPPDYMAGLTWVMSLPEVTAAVLATGGGLVAGRTASIAPPGQARGAEAAIYRISLAAPSGGVSLSLVPIQVQGEMTTGALRFYRDGPGADDGVWQATDTSLAAIAGSDLSAGGWGTFSAFADPAVGTVPQEWFVTLSLSPAAPALVGLTLSIGRPRVNLPYVVDPVPALPPDGLWVTVKVPETLEAGGAAVPSQGFLQGQTTGLAWVTLRASDAAAYLTAIRISLLGNVSPTLCSAKLTGAGVGSFWTPFAADGSASLMAVNAGNDVTKLAVGTSPLAVTLVLSLAAGAPVGGSFGLTLLELMVDAPDTLNLAAGVGHPAGGEWTVTDAPDHVTLSGSDLTPPGFGNGTERAFLRLDLRTGFDFARVTQLRVSLQGTAATTAAAARLYREREDADGWGAGQDSLLGVEAFSAGRWATFSGLAETLAPASTRYYLTLSLWGVAPGETAGMVFSALDASLDAPDLLWSTMPAAGLKVLSTVQAGDVLTLAAAPVAPVQLAPGTSAAFLRLSAWASANTVRMTSVRVSLTGTVPTAGVTLQVYADQPPLGSWEPTGDLLLGSASFNPTDRRAAVPMDRTVDGGGASFFLALTFPFATASPRTVGVTLAAVDLGIEGPDASEAGWSAGAAPVLLEWASLVHLSGEILAPAQLTQGAGPVPLARFSLVTSLDASVLSALTLQVDGRGLAVALYRDGPAAPDGLWQASDLSLGLLDAQATGVQRFSSLAETLSPGASRFFLVGTVPAEGPPGRWAATLSAAGLQVAFPDAAGAGTLGFALSLVDIPDALTLAAADSAPAQHPARGERAYLALTLRVGQDQVEVSTLRLEKLGSLPDAQIAAVQWYRESGVASSWQPTDAVLAFGGFAGGRITLFTPGLVLSSSSGAVETYVTLQLADGAAANETVGVSLPVGGLVLAGADTLAAAEAFASSLALVTGSVISTLTVRSVNPAGAVPQGAADVVLLNLTLGTMSADSAKLERVTLALSRGPSELTLVRLELPALTLALPTFSAGSPVVLTLSPPPSMAPSGTGVFLRGRLAPLAALGPVSATLRGLSALAPDRVEAFGLTHIGQWTVEDAPDLLTLAASEGPASRLVTGAPPAAFLRLDLSLTSSPPDTAAWSRLTLRVVSTVSLTAATASAWLYRDLGDGTFSAASDSVAGSALSSAPGAVVFTLAEPLAGSAARTYWVALSLWTPDVAEALGQSLGLSLEGAEAQAPDAVAVAPAGSSLRPIFDQVVHIRRGPHGTPPTGLTLGTVAELARLTLAPDRDSADFTTLWMTNAGAAPADRDVGPVWLYREDTLLATGSFSGALASLGLAAPLRVGTEGVTLLVRGRIHPLTRRDGRYAAWRMRAQFLQPVVEAKTDPAGVFFEEGASTLLMGVTDFTSPVAITGDSLVAMAFTLSAPADAVGLAALAVTVHISDPGPVTYLSLELREGARLLGEAGEPHATAPFPLGQGQSATFRFTLEEAIGVESRRFFVHVMALANSPPNVRLQYAAGPEGLSLVGPDDRVRGSSLTTSTLQVVSAWGYATIALEGAAALIPATGLTAARGTRGLPVGRLEIKTVEADAVARLVALRLLRLGEGPDTDARLRLFLSDAGLAAFDPSVALEVAEGGFRDRLAALSLINRPFMSNGPRAFWLVLDLMPAARPGATVGVELGGRGFQFQGEYGAQGGRFPFRTPLVTVATPGAGAEATLTVSAEAGPPGAALQGSAVVLATLRAQVVAGQGSVLHGLRMSLLSGAESVARFRLAFEEPNARLLSQGIAGGLAGLTLLWPVSPTLSTAVLEADLRLDAPPGTTLQVAFAPADWLGPSEDVRLVNGGSAWTGAAIPVRDASDILTLSGEGRSAPWELGLENVALRLTLSVDRDAVFLSRLTLAMEGSGAAEVQGWALALPSGERVSLAAEGASASLRLSPAEPWRLAGPTRVAALVCSLAPTVAVTHVLGVSLSGVALEPDPVTGAVEDALVWAGSPGPSLFAIRDPAQPRRPRLQWASRYTADRSALAAVWNAEVRLGTVATSRFALVAGATLAPPDEALLVSLLAGGSPAGLDVVLAPVLHTLEAPGSAVEVSLRQEGVALTHGGTYYLALQAAGDTGVWSDVGTSVPLLVDIRKPEMAARPPAAVVGRRQLLLSWAPPTVGPSGIGAYQVERRRGTSPKWEQVQVFAVGPPRSGRFAPALQPVGRPLAPEPALAALLAKAPDTSTVVALEGGGTYFYRVRAVSAAGEVSEPTPATRVVAGLDDLPGMLNDVSNYPNPFDSRGETTTIVYVLKQDAPVTLKIFTLLGELVTEQRFEAGASGGQAGANETSWDGRNGLGDPVASGMYILRLKIEDAGMAGVPGTTITRKIGVLR